MNEQLQNELEEQARLLGMSAERECDLRGKIERLEHECYSTQSKLSDAEAEIEEIQEQLNAYIMLDKMAMRKFIRELEQERQQWRLSSVCRRLKAENEQLKQQQL